MSKRVVAAVCGAAIIIVLSAVYLHSPAQLILGTWKTAGARFGGTATLTFQRDGKESIVLLDADRVHVITGQGHYEISGDQLTMYTDSASVNTGDSLEGSGMATGERVTKKFQVSSSELIIGVDGEGEPAVYHRE